METDTNESAGRMGGALVAASLILLAACNQHQNLGANGPDGGAEDGAAGAGTGGAGGQAGAGTGGAGGQAGAGTGGAGGQAGAGSGGAGGQAGVGDEPKGVFLSSNPFAPGQATVTVLDLATGTSRSVSFSAPAGGWGAQDVKMLPDGQARLLWNDGGSKSLLYRLDPSLKMVDSITYTLGAFSQYVHHPDGTARLIGGNTVVRLDASEQIDTSAPVVTIGIPAPFLASVTIAPDGTVRAFGLAGSGYDSEVLVLTPNYEPTVISHGVGATTYACPPNGCIRSWLPLSYQLERSGIVHILWSFNAAPLVNTPNYNQQTVLCTYPDEQSLGTFPLATTDAGPPPCEEELVYISRYSSTP